MEIPTLKLFIIVFTIISVYVGGMYILIKQQTKIDKKNTFVNNNTGIRFKAIRQCWLYDEETKICHPSVLLIMLDDKENELNHLPIAIKSNYLFSNYTTLEDKEKEEKSC